MQPSHTPAPAQLAELLLSVADWAKSQAHARLARHGLTPARGRILTILSGSGPTRVTALAQTLGITARSVTESLDTLELDGLISRATDRTDGRAVLVDLTPRGSALITGGSHSKDQALHAIFEVLDEAERREFHRILAKIDGSPRPRTAPG
ncbi:MarR family winged helix-turn-helix transcriptional regulator [Streptomyces varsoviensis]|uniref:MarR family winged helix-turn-helix transcriptional regulator n=1 Tax=Streptomyces varsoviensis TaxID=67373 RepID=UPI000689E28A|nr:MarR family winged helix-turn-helix transcriptional regulator [Streptomyces varsoviensis]